jgi:2-methylfumaryl-CoA isomerase
VPLAGMTLAQMGADVIRFDRIERRPRRQPLAGYGPSGKSLFWAGLNKGKRSIAVDIASDPEGQASSSRRSITAPGPDAGCLLDQSARARLDGLPDAEARSVKT